MALARVGAVGVWRNFARIFIRLPCIAVIWSCAGLLLVLVAPHVAVHAQSTNAEPGKIEDRIQKPAARPPSPAPRAAPALPAPNLRPDGIGTKFVLAGVEITGATVYPTAAFAPLYEQLLASEIAVDDVRELVERINQKYRDDGYFLANAMADPQDLALGVLRVRIVEGHIERITFSGDLDRHQDRLDAFAAKIKVPGPARLERLERYMLLMDDLPGVTVDGSVKPIDKDKGAFELMLAITHRMVDGYGSIDNRGTRAVGAYQALVQGNLNNGLVEGGRTALTLFTIPASPQELRYGELLHEHQFGTEGFRVWMSAAHSTVDAGGTSAANELESRSWRGLFGLSYPIIRSRDHNLTISGRFDVANQRQDEFNVRDFDDRLRVLRLGVNYGLNDDFGGINALNIELSQGFDVLGASVGEYVTQNRSPSRTDGSAKFTKVKLSVSRRQELSKRWAAQLSLSGQKSDRRLLSGEEFYLGGTQFGRAFDSGEISGSDGAAASLELQFGDFLSKPYLDSYQFYAFYDYGVVWETENTDYNGLASLSSAGGGVRIGITESLFGGLEYAKPLTREVSNWGNKDARTFFYLLYSL